MVKDKEVINDYKFLGAHSLYNDPDNMWDATWVDLLHSVKDQLKVGQSYNLKMTVYTWKDGANQEKLAEGTIALQITAASMEWLNKVIGWKEEKENQ
jgi:alanine dehydrogenase